MERYVVEPFMDGWKIKGAKEQKIFRTKSNAVEVARIYAKRDHTSLIVYSREGKISSVNSFSNNQGTGRLLSANVKRKFSNKKVRASIARVIESKGSTSKH